MTEKEKEDILGTINKLAKPMARRIVHDYVFNAPDIEHTSVSSQIMAKLAVLTAAIQLVLSAAELTAAVAKGEISLDDLENQIGGEDWKIN